MRVLTLQVVQANLPGRNKTVLYLLSIYLVVHIADSIIQGGILSINITIYHQFTELDVNLEYLAVTTFCYWMVG